MTVRLDPWQITYRHAPSDGRPCRIVYSGCSDVVNVHGLVRVGFTDGDYTPDTPWSELRFEWVARSELKRVK